MKKLLVLFCVIFSLNAMEKKQHYMDIPFAKLALNSILSAENSGQIIEIIRAQYNEYIRIKKIIADINRARRTEVITLKPFEELCGNDLMYIQDWLIANKTQLLAEPIERLIVCITNYFDRIEAIEGTIEKTEKLLKESA